MPSDRNLEEARQAIFSMGSINRPLSLDEKLSRAYNHVNGEVMLDEVKDGLLSTYSKDQLDKLSVNDIIQYIIDGEWIYGPL